MPITSFTPSRGAYIIPDSLTHSSGVITATVYGQAYTVALTGLVAHNLYFLYLLSGTLQSSLTVPSTYRIANPSAVLVGAFYANGMSTIAFGSFVNIEGVPTSGWNATTIGLRDSNGSGNNVLSAAPAMNTRRWRRSGSMIQEEMGYYQNSTLGVAGSGVYGLQPPTNLGYDLTSVVAGGGNSANIGQCALDIGGSNSFRQGYMSKLTNFHMNFAFLEPSGTQSFLASSSYPLSSNFLGFTARFEVPIAGWTETPLKDL